MRKMHIVADILDKQIVDSNSMNVGKVDGLVLVLRQGKPPRVAAIEIGNGVLLRRIGKWTERFGLSRFRIAWSKVKKVDIDVELDFDASETPPLAWERRLGALVAKVPVGR